VLSITLHSAAHRSFFSRAEPLAAALVAAKFSSAVPLVFTFLGPGQDADGQLILQALRGALTLGRDRDLALFHGFFSETPSEDQPGAALTKMSAKKLRVYLNDRLALAEAYAKSLVEEKKTSVRVAAALKLALEAKDAVAASDVGFFLFF
jgi:hypothetical protein